MIDRQELKGREQHYNVSTFAAGRGCSVIIALIFGAWGAGLIYLVVHKYEIKPPQLAIPVAIFGICLIIGSIALILQTSKKPKRHFNSSFSEYEHLKKTRLPNFFFFIFGTVFSSMFVGVGIFGKEFMFLLIGLLFLGLILIGGIYGFIKNEKRIKLTKIHGSTHLIQNTPLILGNVAEFKIKNNSRDLENKEIKVQLRFIEELYVSDQKRRGKKSSKLKIFSSYEEEHTISLQNGSSELFKFNLPADSSTTDMNFQEPKYWELFCSSEESHYSARFILDVRK